MRDSSCSFQYKMAKYCQYLTILESIVQIDDEEEKAYIESLRAHGRLLETDDENAPIPPGVTHFLIVKPGEPPRLVRKRYS